MFIPGGWTTGGALWGLFYGPLHRATKGVFRRASPAGRMGLQTLLVTAVPTWEGEMGGAQTASQVDSKARALPGLLPTLRLPGFPTLTQVPLFS